MSEYTPPRWFGHDAESDKLDEARRRKKLEKELPSLLRRHAEKKGGRASSFYPYLLVRSVLGDRGDRPFNAPFWESPDIWVAPGNPATAPDVPPSHGGPTVLVSHALTIYAHVWNLGFAPLVGVRVEFYWFKPIGDAVARGAQNLIGVARCELAGRGMRGSHKLVKCPTAWVPQFFGSECLIVRVSGVGDPIGNNAWAPWQNRHVAQRLILVDGGHT
jgi:hypothetical protein